MSENVKINNLVDKIVKSYDQHGGINHIEGCILPSQNSVVDIIECLMDIYFPGFFTKEEIHHTQIREFATQKVLTLRARLLQEISKSLNLCKDPLLKTKDKAQLQTLAEQETETFLNKIPAIRETLKTDVDAYYANDPAAKSHEEVIVSYPGLFAIAVYRSAHELYSQGIPLIPRIMTEYAHNKTGIDINPGAKIGQYFFIDHGTGVVIGETCVIGKHCKLYQGVTLGALKIEFDRDESGNLIDPNKRHPTLEDDVTIYAGATILGGTTTLKKGTVVGGNAFVTATTEVGDKVIFDAKETQKVFKKK